MYCAFYSVICPLLPCAYDFYVTAANWNSHKVLLTDRISSPTVISGRLPAGNLLILH